MSRTISRDVRASMEAHLDQAPRLLHALVRLALALSRWSAGLPVIGKSFPGIRRLAQSFTALHFSAPLVSVLSGDDQAPACSLNGTIETRILIVGSGPGAAAHLQSSSEKDFLIVERGDVSDSRFLPHSVVQMYAEFQSGGQSIIVSKPPIPFAEGMVWGGGSAVNSGLYHELPEAVLDEWVELTGISKSLFRLSEKEVRRDLKIKSQTHPQLGVYENSPLLEMASVLNLEGGVVPRWRTYSDSTTYTHHGVDSALFGSLHPGRRVLNHSVDRISIEKDAIVAIASGRECEHTIRAGRAVLSGGTLRTPELLIRSRLAVPNDFDFMFHGMHRVIGQFDRPVNDLVDIDPHQFWSPDFTSKFGASATSTDLIRSTLAAVGADSSVSDFTTVGSYYSSTPSHGTSGLMKVGATIYPYFFGSQTYKESAKHSIELLKKGIEAAGGRILGQAVPASTVHIFGSMPLGQSRLIDSSGYLLASDRVLIRDSSLLPIHPLVNPQGPLMALVKTLDRR